MACNHLEEDYDHPHVITITNTTLVHDPNDNSMILKLSNLDRKCPALMYLVFFYKNIDHDLSDEYKSFFRDLKKGLEETLSVWYPAAGRLTADRESGRLDLACNNGGVLLVEAATQVHISDLGDLSHGNYSNHFFEKLVFRPHSFSSPANCFSEVPLVVAQVTRFGCGGYSVGVGTNHSLFDGLANFNFLSAWASKTASRQNEEVEAVLHDRSRLLIDQNAQTQHMSTRIMAFDHLHQLIKQAASLQEIFMEPGGEELLEGCNKFSQIIGTADSKEDFVLRTFSVSSDMVEKLKTKVTSSRSAGSPCSSFEVVAAHLWKARTKAIGISKERTVCLQFSVDARTRMSPPLPKGFAGNAYILSSISSTCGDLLQETLSSVVEKIKEAKHRVTKDYVRAYLSALDEPASPCMLLPPLPELTVVSDWRRTPYDKVDFGIGKAVRVVPLAAPLREVAYFMQSPGDDEEGGGFDVRIGLVRKHVARFCHYFFDEL